MSRDKQIEEMAKVLYESDNKRNVVICGVETVAEDIYNAGYRKASDVAREIFEEIEKYNRPPIPECEAVYVMKKSEFEALKNKYTEEGK